MPPPLKQFFYDEVHKANAFLLDAGFQVVDEESIWYSTVGYENESIKVRHRFGDKDSLFNTLVRLKEKENREYALWEFLEAFDTRAERKITDNLISTEEALLKLIQDSAMSLEQNLDRINNHTESILASMDSARDKVREAWEAKWK